ncbi:beta-hexosaminidase [gut metagenome]|uniref:Beta-hexosaminidase n=1 Tax=gut metagenome TaxID=749906 RepID=J9FEY3_9ZZZZ
MKNKLLSLLFLLLPLPCFALDNDFVNLTPTPKTMTVEAGELVLPPSFSISTTALPEEMVVEVERFAKALRQTTGFAVLHAANDNEALIQVVESASQLDPEGYQLDITSKGITVAASTADGLYFAFQSIKKMLPPHVMAGVADSKVLRYALPLVSINDAPVSATAVSCSTLPDIITRSKN